MNHKHKWVEDSGQPCPENIVLEKETIDKLPVHCYRPYYVCEICGEHDYGKISLEKCNKCELAKEKRRKEKLSYLPLYIKRTDLSWNF